MARSNASKEALEQNQNDLAFESSNIASLNSAFGEAGAKAVRKLLNEMNGLTKGTVEYLDKLKQISELWKDHNKGEKKGLEATNELRKRELELLKDKVELTKKLEVEQEKADKRNRERELKSVKDNFGTNANDYSVKGIFAYGKKLNATRSAGIYSTYKKALDKVDSYDDKLLEAADKYGEGSAEYQALLNEKGRAETRLRNAEGIYKKDLKFQKGSAVAEAVLRGAVNSAKAINNAFKQSMGISLSIKDNFSDMMKNVGEMLSTTNGMATYDTGSSLFMNASARQRSMQYGLSGSQTYGMSKAMSLLNMTDEDLLWMNSNQKTAYSQYSEKYAQWYEQLSSSGVLESIQKLQLDMSMMKEELAVEFLQFFAENKDSIMSLLRGTFTILKWIMTGVMNIVSGLHLGSSYNIEQLSSGSNTSIQNISMTATANGVDNSEQMQSYFTNKFNQFAMEIATAY